MIRPDAVRAHGQLEFSPIPINQYNKTLSQELDSFAREDLLRIHRDMVVIRTFESMLNEVKIKGAFGGIEYNHRGPAHLSIGQEASAVGQAFHLGVDDHIFGSHRSHGDILAKSLSAIDKMSDDALLTLMRGYMDGQILRIIEKDATGDVKDLAIDFLLYGALAEIFGREAGFNKGMGGSMHAFFTPFGVYPNNAIVGGSADISVGAALYKKVNQKPGIVICNIGDAAAGCGPTWEALCFATMEQFKTLWDDAHKGGLPLIMNFVNNFYGMGGQPVGETMGFQILARMGAGINPEQMHAERIDGYNPLAVIDAIARKKEILARGDGPVLLDTITYRFSGHSPSDASSYREKSEVEEWRNVDSLITYADSLKANGVATENDIATLQEKVDAAILRAYKKSIDLDLSPRADLYSVGSLLENTMYSNGRVESFDPSRTPDANHPLAENVRVKDLAKRSRTGIDPDGKPLPKGRCIAVRDALFEAVADRFYKDATMIAYGEENRDWGGAFAVYRGLTEALPYHRLFNSPISEAAIAGTAVGYALEGGRPLIELMYCDFLGRAGDEVFNQMAKWQSMSGGLLTMPIVMRVSVGSKYGAQHSQDWTALVAHIPGLQVVFPGYTVRFQGPDGVGACRHRPGYLLREPAYLRYARTVPRGRCPGRLLRDSAGRAGYQKGRQGHHDPDHRGDALPRDRYREDTRREVRPVGGDHRRPVDCPVQLRPRDRVGQEDRPHPAGIRRLRAWQLPADHVREDRPARLRLPRRPAGGCRRPATGSPRPTRSKTPSSRSRRTSSTRSTSTSSRSPATPSTAPATAPNSSAATNSAYSRLTCNAHAYA